MNCSKFSIPVVEHTFLMKIFHLTVYFISIYIHIYILDLLDKGSAPRNVEIKFYKVFKKFHVVIYTYLYISVHIYIYMYIYVQRLEA